MKLLIDAHLPLSLAELFKTAGHEVLHTRDLPLGNRTSDAEINRISVAEQRIVVTKDADFVNSLILYGRPHKLLLVSTGNISNSRLLELFRKNLAQIVAALEDHSYVELEYERINIHR